MNQTLENIHYLNQLLNEGLLTKTEQFKTIEKIKELNKMLKEAN